MCLLAKGKKKGKKKGGQARRLSIDALESSWISRAISELFVLMEALSALLASPGSGIHHGHHILLFKSWGGVLEALNKTSIEYPVIYQMQAI